MVFHLYQHFDKYGNLLYTGKSVSSAIPALTRFSGHKGQSSWVKGDLVKTMTIECFGTGAELAAAEIKIIETKNPPFNKKHNKKYSRALCEEILARGYVKETPKCREISEEEWASIKKEIYGQIESEKAELEKIKLEKEIAEKIDAEERLAKRIGGITNFEPSSYSDSIASLREELSAQQVGLTVSEIKKIKKEEQLKAVQELRASYKDKKTISSRRIGFGGGYWSKVPTAKVNWYPPRPTKVG